MVFLSEGQSPKPNGKSGTDEQGDDAGPERQWVAGDANLRLKKQPAEVPDSEQAEQHSRDAQSNRPRMQDPARVEVMDVHDSSFCFGGAVRHARLPRVAGTDQS